ncbi:unnamed protein product, partial [Amoebophrya sp. A25]
EWLGATPRLPPWERLAGRERLGGANSVCRIISSTNNAPHGDITSSKPAIAEQTSTGDQSAGSDGAAETASNITSPEDPSPRETDAAKFQCLRGERIFVCDFDPDTHACTLKRLASAADQKALIRTRHEVLEQQSSTKDSSDRFCLTAEERQRASSAKIASTRGPISA